MIVRPTLFIIFLFLVTFMSTYPAYAYIGPGIGAGTLAVVVGILGSIALAIFAILWYPIKRIMKKRKENSAKTETPDTSSASD